MSSGGGAAVSTTTVHGPGACSQNGTGSHHELVITYRPSMHHANERESRDVSTGPLAP